MLFVQTPKLQLAFVDLQVVELKLLSIEGGFHLKRVSIFFFWMIQACRYRKPPAMTILDP